MRALICWIVIFLMPSAVFAEDATPGVLSGTGSVYLDGSKLANSSPVMSDDVIETKEAGVAHLEMGGSTALIQPDAIVRFKSSSLSLDRGSISVATGKSLSVSARDFQITPVSEKWTQFDVTRSSGLIHIAARKNSVSIRCGMGAPTIVREGHEITRADAQNCGLADTARSGAPTAAHGPILASPWAERAAAGVAAGVLIWTFTHDDDPMSPSKP